MQSRRAVVRATALLLLATTAIVACSGSQKTQRARQRLPPTTRATAPTPTAAPPTATQPTAVRPTAAHPATPCGWPAPPPVTHVIWIWMENRAYGDVLGSGRQAPHLSSYARACGLATSYRAITHPSLPNYLAATSGSTGGVTSDCSPSECPQHRTSLFAQLDNAGLQWRTYAEAMPTPCNRVSQGRYATKHNPAVYFPAIRSRCTQWDLPIGGAGGPFATALDDNGLPAFTFVEPDLCDDGHDCSTRFADEWLGAILDRITYSASYRAGDVAVFVTWDEGIGADQQVATVVVAPGVPRGTRSGTRFTHYSLLRTTEALLGLPPLGAASDARDMRTAFGLRGP
jgi:phosphatidylinositol-3-phosphatase